MSNILIVEDETILSDAYSIILNHHGHITEVATNGVEALEKLKTFKPDLILLDLLMPTMDGIGFLKAYKRDPGKSPHIIVYSNLYDARKEAEVRALGAVKIVLKSSITPNGLVELVTEQLKAQ